MKCIICGKKTKTKLWIDYYTWMYACKEHGQLPFIPDEYLDRVKSNIKEFSIGFRIEK